MTYKTTINRNSRMDYDVIFDHSDGVKVKVGEIRGTLFYPMPTVNHFTLDDLQIITEAVKLQSTP